MIATAWLLALAALAPSPEARSANTGTLVLRTESGAHSYAVEVAVTDIEKARGLMFRRSLPEDSGMLFSYDPPQAVTMWMRNTYIPLDMIFIAPDGRVHRIEANTEPFSTDVISSGGKVAAVLELNAGQAEKIGLRPGDRVVYPGLFPEPE